MANPIETPTPACDHPLSLSHGGMVRLVAMTLILASCVLGGGCRKRKPSASAPTSAQSAEQPSDSEGNPSAGPRSASSAKPKPVEYLPDLTDNDRRITMHLDQKIADFWQKRGRAPKSVEELVAEKFISAMPPVPPGRKLVISPDQQSAIFIAQ